MTAFSTDRWLYENETIEGDDLSGDEFPPVECYDVTFRRVSFAESTLRRWCFEDCTFVDCDLSLCVLEDCALQTVRFEGCKLVGVDWSRPSQTSLSVSFERCTLRLGNLAGVRLRESSLVECDLREADLTGTDFTGSDLRRSNLMGALLEGTVLEHADLRDVRGLELRPEMRFRGAKVSVEVAIALAQHLGLQVE